MKTAFITGADRGIGFSLCQCFLKDGWKVFAGRFMKDWTELDTLKEEHPDLLIPVDLDVSSKTSVEQAFAAISKETAKLDVLVNCAGIFQNNSTQTNKLCLDINAVGPVRIVETFLPLMEQGEKRICFFSSEAGSVTLAHRTGDVSYCVSKTCLNMAVRLMFERLQPHGYRFRLYHPGWVRTYMSGQKATEGNYEPEESAAVAYRQFLSDRSCEDLLVMSDVSDEIWPF